MHDPTKEKRVVVRPPPVAVVSTPAGASDRMPIDWGELARAAGTWSGQDGKRPFPEAEFQQYRSAYLARLAPAARTAFVARWGNRVRT
jgi:hypothetical protein